MDLWDYASKSSTQRTRRRCWLWMGEPSASQIVSLTSQFPVGSSNEVRQRPVRIYVIRRGSSSFQSTRFGKLTSESNPKAHHSPTDVSSCVSSANQSSQTAWAEWSEWREMLEYDWQSCKQLHHLYLIAILIHRLFDESGYRLVYWHLKPLKFVLARFSRWSEHNQQPFRLFLNDRNRNQKGVLNAPRSRIAYLL